MFILIVSQDKTRQRQVMFLIINAVLILRYDLCSYHEQKQRQITRTHGTATVSNQFIPVIDKLQSFSHFVQCDVLYFYIQYIHNFIHFWLLYLYTVFYFTTCKYLFLLSSVYTIFIIIVFAIFLMLIFYVNSFLICVFE